MMRRTFGTLISSLEAVQHRNRAFYEAIKLWQEDLNTLEMTFAKGHHGLGGNRQAIL